MPATPPAPNLHPPAPSPDPTPAVVLDQLLHAWQSRFTAGRSPSTLGMAFLDWAAHALNAPFEMAELGGVAQAQWGRLARVIATGEPAIEPASGDNRFADPAWRHFPFTVMTQSVLLGEEWWDRLVRSPHGVGRPNKRAVQDTCKMYA